MSQKITEKEVADALLADAYLLVTQKATNQNGDEVESLRRIPLAVAAGRLAQNLAAVYTWEQWNADPNVGERNPLLEPDILNEDEGYIYSDALTMVNGKLALENPVTAPVPNSVDDLYILRGKYVQSLSGLIYIPADADYLLHNNKWQVSNAIQITDATRLGIVTSDSPYAYPNEGDQEGLWYIASRQRGEDKTGSSGSAGAGGGIVKSISFEIRPEDWTKDASPANGYLFRYDLLDGEITEDMIPEIVLSEGSLEVAKLCGMCATAVSLPGLVCLKCVERPGADISAVCNLYSAGASDVASQMPIATADTVGGIKSSDTINVDDDGTAHAVASEISDSAYASDEDVAAILNDIFGGETAAESE